MTARRLAWLNSTSDARDALLACYDVPRWATAVLERRPYANVDQLLATADTVARTVTDAEVDRALAAHPRIGERVEGAGAAAAFSRREQAAALDSVDGPVGDDSGPEALLAANRAYEQRFGRVFLICASGRSAADVVAAARARLGNDDATERQVVADELRRIALLRLRALAGVDSAAVTS